MNKKPVIIFFGNTKYSVLGAKIIQKIYPISLFVTIPDRMVGREKILTASPIKLLAQENSVPVLETDKLDEQIIEKVKGYQPDFIVVEDYRLILPSSLLEISKVAPLNIHHSLLPKYRGPSPAPSAILAGEKISGVSIIKMTDKVDAGDILVQKEYELSGEETTDSLLTKLNEEGGKLMVEVISQYLKGQAQARSQDETKAIYTKMMRKDDGYIDLTNPPSPEVLDRMIRAYYPWPTVWTKWQGKVVKLLPEKMIQMEGKKPTKLTDFLRGHPNFPLQLTASQEAST